MDKAIEETNTAKKKPHWLSGRVIVSADGRAKYRVDDNGAYHRLNPTDSKKARRKAAQRERRRRQDQH